MTEMKTNMAITDDALLLSEVHLRSAKFADEESAH
jgi:hypothetical protein